VTVRVYGTGDGAIAFDAVDAAGRPVLDRGIVAR
jgi:hypothetical protein